MREIIVGKQLSRIEQRLNRLEHFFESPQFSNQDAFVRIENLEAQFETAKDNMQHQVDHIRLEIGSEMANRHSQVHRPAEHIQQSALLQNEIRLQAQSGRDIEQRVGNWLGQWQTSLEDFLGKRESWLIQEIREWVIENAQKMETHQQKELLDLESKRLAHEQSAVTQQKQLEQLKHLVAQQQQKLQALEIQHQQNQQTHQTRLSQIAQAARALSESTASLGSFSTDSPSTMR